MTSTEQVTDYDRQDSGMMPGERGTPYTMAEAKSFVDGRRFLSADVAEIIRFLIRRVERLEKSQEDVVYKAFLRAKETAPEPDCILVENPDGLTDEQLQSLLDYHLKKKIEQHNEKVLLGEATGYLG